MKMTNKISKKLIVSTLSTVMGVSLVGAITGTVAWYQYSTRSTVSFVGTTIRSSENLQFAFAQDGEYDNDKTSAQVLEYLQGKAGLMPVTTGAIEKDAALPAQFLANPTYQRFGYENWVRAERDAYVQFTIYLKLNKVQSDVNGGQPQLVEAPRKVYLSDLTIQDDVANALGDVSEAIRVHLHSDHEDMLLGKNGDDTELFGALDLNADGTDDTVEAIYDFTDLSQTHTGIYGHDGDLQEKYAPNEVYPTGADAEGHLTGNHYLGTLFSKEVTPEASENPLGEGYFLDPELQNSAAEAVPNGTTAYYVRQEALPITITIWLEGWQKLEDIKKVQLPANYNLDNLVYFTNADLAEEHKVAANTVALGTETLYVDDGEGNPVEKHPIAGQKLNDGVVYYTDIKLSEQATGLANGTAEYYYSNGKSASWDVLNYVAARFDVGLLFEVDA